MCLMIMSADVQLAIASDLLHHGYSPNAVACDLDHTLEPQSTHSLVRYSCSHCSPSLPPDWSSRLAVVGEVHLTA